MKSCIRALTLFIVLICIGCTTSASDLIGAAFKGELQRVRELIDQGADVNKADTDGVTPLFIASLNGHDDVVKLILAASPEVNKADTDGVTPLYMASQKSHADVGQITPGR